MLSQPSGQISLGSNPFFSAPSVEVTDIPSRGSTVGRCAESLSRGRTSSPSGVVPPSSQDDVMPPIHVYVPNVVSIGLAGVSGSQHPPLGVSAPVHGRSDQLRDRGDVGLTQHVASADIHAVPRSVSSFDPTSLLFPFSDSGFFSLSASAPPVSSFSSSSSFSVASAPSFAPPFTVPVFSLPSVVPSVLSTPLHSAPPLPASSSFPFGPPPGFSSSVSFLPSSLSSSSASSFFPVASSASSSSTWFSLLPSSSGVSASSVLPPVSSSSSAPSLDFASYQVRVLGLSDEYQALGRWYFASGGTDFPAYLSSHFPHLYSDFCLDFSSGSSRFLSALASAPPPPVPVPSSSPLPRSLPFSLPRSSAPSSSTFPLSSSSFTSLAFPFSVRLGSSPPTPLAPSHSHPPGFYPSVSSSPFPVRPSAALHAGVSLGVPVSAGVGVAARFAVPDAPPVSAPSFFHPFASDPSALSGYSTPPPAPLAASSDFPLSASTLHHSVPSSVDPAASFGFGASEDLPEDSPPDTVPRVLDPGLAAVPESVRSEFRRMMSFIVDLFPQAAGSPSVSPPPHALFVDFFSSSTPPSSPIFLNWFERIRSALFQADSRLANFVASGRGDFLFLPSHSPVYAVHGEFALGGAAPVNPSLLSLFERRLKPLNHVGLSIRKDAAFEALLHSQSEALSHSMWVLSALLAFVRFQNFTPEDSALFNTLVTSLSKSLAHQASLTATHTAFLGLKRHQFYLSHLPSYFSDVNKRAMLSSPVVLASSLFAEPDVARLLSDTQTSSSLRSQQALVDVVARGSGARSRRSPFRFSPARHRSRKSGSPSRPQKRVRFDSPAPASALHGSRSGFRR